MTGLRVWWTRFVEWTDTREPVVGLAVFRICVGLILGKVLLAIWVLGVREALYTTPADGGLTALGTSWRLDLLGGPTPLVVDAAFGVTLAACAALVLGVAPNVAAFVAGQGFLAINELHGDAGGGHDKLITNACWLLCLSPAGRSLSLGAWWAGRWFDPTPRAAWPRALLVLQISVVYTFAGIAKASPEWWPWGGLDAVYRSLLQPQWNELDTTWVAHVYPLTQLMTLLTMGFEIGFFVVPLWMVARWRWPRLARWDVRPLFLGLGLGMHAMLEGFMDLGPFALISVSYYVLFFSAEEVSRAVAFVRSYLRPRPDTGGQATP